MAEPAFKREPDSAYEAALKAALDELAAARQESDRGREQLQRAEARAIELADLVRKLLVSLPTHRQSLYAESLNQVHPARRSAARNLVFDNVVDLFARQKREEWTAADIRKELDGSGFPADPKAIHNVLNYLFRKGKLQRVGRGRYYVKDYGFGVQLADDLDGTDPNEGGCE